jgi:hypothetical protein
MGLYLLSKHALYTGPTGIPSSHRSWMRKIRWSKVFVTAAPVEEYGVGYIS